MVFDSPLTYSMPTGYLPRPAVFLAQLRYNYLLQTEYTASAVQ